MWRQVKLKEKRNIMEFDLKNVSAKKHKETEKGCISLKSIIFAKKKIFCLDFSPIAKLWPRKKVIFKVFIFWRYSKTLISLPLCFLSLHILQKYQFSCVQYFITKLKLKLPRDSSLKTAPICTSFVVFVISLVFVGSIIYIFTILNHIN